MNTIFRTFYGLAVVLLFSAVSFAQQASEPPLITVTGQAELRVAPDEVIFTLEVKKLDKNLLVAKEQNDQGVRRILELTRTYNIAPADVQTDYISVEPKYHFEGVKRSAYGEETVGGTRVFDGYEVSKTVVIRLKEISRFESLLSDILKAGVDRVSDVTFRTRDIRKHKDQARALAIKAAQEKAIALTKEIGQTIGKAYSIREEGYRYSSSSNVAANNTTVISGSYSPDDNEGSTIAPGMITVTATVTVSFRLL